MSTARPSSPGVSARMGRQARRDTKPELAIRKLLHAAGYRFRVNTRVPDMPRRTIDIAFTRAKVAVMIDGCFWHGCPVHATQPKSNAQWWREKLERNMARDAETTAHLIAAGWTVVRSWEHEPPPAVAERVAATVDQARSSR
ncbi:very short patch repair endonuclease [Streptomyces atroolivaceus]|uniref:very short patch repair endonuclease n=1 Tax=Streptomyces atroolivaceus TaxID=66869 RepID=UPI0036A6063D